MYYLVEKSLKSPMRSHTRRPIRDALLEYAGPMPFFVVPMLSCYKFIQLIQSSTYFNVCLRLIVVLFDTYFFPSCACLSDSCKPSTTWWKSKTVETYDAFYFSNQVYRRYTFERHKMLFNIPRWALSETISLFSHPFRPAYKYMSKWAQTTQTSFTPFFKMKIPFFSFLSPSSNNPGKCMTTPLPEKAKESLKVVK